MPARVREGDALRTPMSNAPASSTGRTRTLQASRATTISSRRTIKSSQAKTIASPDGPSTQAKVVTTSERKQHVGIEEDDASLLTLLSSASKCKPETVQAMLFTLDVSLDDLALCLLHRSDSQSTSRSTSRARRAYSVKTDQRSAGTTPLQSTTGHTAKLSGRTLLFAKQAVNTIIVAINDLVTSGWKASNAESNSLSNSSTPTSSRPSSSNNSRHINAATRQQIERKIRQADPSKASSARTCVDSPQGKTSSISVSRVTALFDCLRIAIRFLVLRSNSSVAIEIDKIVVSVIRKLIALDMYHAADVELSWLRTDRLESHFTSSTMSTISENIGLVIPEQIETVDMAVLVLEVQALSFVTALFYSASETPQSQRAILDAAVEDKNGPFQAQVCARHVLSTEVDAKIIDRSAYTVERAIMRLASSIQDTSSSSKGDENLFACRAASLQFLLTVSDLDLDAFWDRVSRVGVSHFRARSLSVSRQEAFAEVDVVFKRLLEQSSAHHASTASTKGFKTFAETWINLARKAGHVDAMRFVERTLLRHATVSPSLNLSMGDADVHISRCCSSIAIADTALERAADDMQRQTDEVDKLLRSALGELDSAASVLNSSSIESKTKILKESSNIRRRCFALLELKEDGQTWRDTCLQVVTATTRVSRTFLLVQTDEVEPKLAETALIDFVQAMRYTAKVIFEIGARESHDRSASLLDECETVLGQAKKLETDKKAKLLHSLSSSWQYAGAQLYAQKQAGAAIRFIKRSVELAEQSHALFKAAQCQELFVDPQTEEMMSQQAASLPKRWEHLGVCYRLTSQPALADNAYRKAVASVSSEIWEKIEVTAADTFIGPIAVACAKDAEARPVMEVAHLVRVAFEIEAFELMSLGSGRSTIFDDIKSASRTTLVLSMLLDHCLASVEESMHRDEALAAYKTLVDLQVETCPADRFPLRRSRALLQKLEVIILQNVCSTETEQTQSLIEEVELLLNTPPAKEDQSFECYRAQYQACFGLLRAILTHNDNSQASRALMQSYIDDAIQYLRSLVPQNITSVRNKATAQRPLRSTTTPRQVKGRTRSSSATPKTPPNRLKVPHSLSKAISGGTYYDATVQPSSATHPIENQRRLLQLMELVQEMEISHGFVLQSIELAEIARKMCLGGTVDEFAKATYLRCSSALIRQYIALGKLAHAKATLEQVYTYLEHWDTASDDARARICFAEAEYYSVIGEEHTAKAAFDRASDIGNHVDPQARTSGMQAAIEKALLVERQSIALCTYAQIQASIGQGTQCMVSSINAIKAAMRGGMMLARLTCDSKFDGKAVACESPFDSLQGKKSGEQGAVGEDNWESDKKVLDDTRLRRRPYFTSRSVGILYWRMVKALRQAYCRLSGFHMLRGSVRDAEAFKTECIEFASKAYCASALATALIDRGCLLLQMGKLDQAAEDIERAMTLVQESKAPKLRATLSFLFGDRCFRLGSFVQAKQHYDDGWNELASIDAAVARLTMGDGRSAESDDKFTSLSVAHVSLLRRKTWLTHVMQEEDDEGCLALMEHARQCCSEAGEIDVLLGKIAVRGALSELRKDQRLCLATEAAIALPRAVVEDSVKQSYGASKTGETGQVASSRLTRSLAHFQRVIDAAGTRCTSSVALGEAVMYSVLSQIVVENLPSTSTMDGNAATQHPVRAFTLEHELIDSIENKINPTRDVTGKMWPRFASDVTAADADVATKSKRMLAVALHKSLATKSRAFTTDEGSSESEQDSDQRTFWHSVLELRGPNAKPPALPRHWTVVSIALSRERNSLLITRENHRHGNDEEDCSPVVFSIPIDRQSRREGEEDTTIGIDDVLGEIRDIVEESNTATHAAQHLDGLEARKAWWLRRRALDERLKTQLNAIETTWLGAFKSLLLPAPETRKSASREGLRTALHDILVRACFPTPSASPALRLNPCVVDTLCEGLDSARCTDEDLEDVVHFIMDAYQLQGAPVAVDEVDLDQCVTDVRSALEAFRGRTSQDKEDESAAERQDNEDAHLFLILDKDMCAIPWESLPCLRGRAVCRVPSLSFLYDRLLMAPDGRFTVNAATAKHYYLINPSQELTRTQERFLPYFRTERGTTSSSDPPLLSTNNANASSSAAAAPHEHRSARWRGLAGRAPTMDEFGRALETNDVVLYFGHGGAEQFVRASRLRSMAHCAVTMLWGCSSAVLRDMGDFDRTGTPYNYLLAGCPSLVGNLWDATDKELDGVCESTLRLFGIITDKATAVAGPRAVRKVSIAQAVAQSRDACKLPYLTGAACVVYGVPVYYEI